MQVKRHLMLHEQLHKRHRHCAVTIQEGNITFILYHHAHRILIHPLQLCKALEFHLAGFLTAAAHSCLILIIKLICQSVDGLIIAPVSLQLFNARLHICFRKAVQCLRIRCLIKIQTLITICQHHHLTIRRKQQLDDDMGNKGELLCIIDMHILIPGGKGLQNGRCTH